MQQNQPHATRTGTRKHRRAYEPRHDKLSHTTTSHSPLPSHTTRHRRSPRPAARRKLSQLETAALNASGIRGPRRHHPRCQNDTRTTRPNSIPQASHSLRAPFNLTSLDLHTLFTDHNRLILNLPGVSFKNRFRNFNRRSRTITIRDRRTFISMNTRIIAFSQTSRSQTINRRPRRQ